MHMGNLVLTGIGQGAAFSCLLYSHTKNTALVKLLLYSVSAVSVLVSCKVIKD